MKEIVLSRGKVAFVDDEDYEWLNQWKWTTIGREPFWYAGRCDYSQKRKQHILMHRLILKPPASLECDHINGDGLDNRRANLRAATRSQNQMNRQPHTGATSSFKGIHWDHRRRKWRAHIWVGGRNLHLGRFQNEKDAARAYNEAAIKYFGEFAWLNQIQEEQ